MLVDGRILERFGHIFVQSARYRTTDTTTLSLFVRVDRWPDDWALVEGVERARAASGDGRPAMPDVDWLREQRNALAHGGATVVDEPALRAAAEGALRVAFKLLFAAAWR